MFLVACDRDSSFDCIQKAGTIIKEEIPITPFEKVLVNRDIQLSIEEGQTFKVVLETGENLINDIDVKVTGDQLQLTDNNTCNFIRDYGITKVFVTAPNLTEIRTSSQYTVSSVGTLNYESLKLLSEDSVAPDLFTVGDFNLDIKTNQLDIISNNISSFYISGTTESLFVGFYAGIGRFEGENLIAEQVSIFHRGSNDMIVHAVESLSGELRGTGNVIVVNQPTFINVDQLYTGSLILN